VSQEFVFFDKKFNADDIAKNLLASSEHWQEYTTILYKNPIKLLQLDVVPETEGVM